MSSLPEQPAVLSGGIRMGSAPLSSPGSLSCMPTAWSPQVGLQLHQSTCRFLQSTYAVPLMGPSVPCTCCAARGPCCLRTPCSALWGWAPTPLQPPHVRVCTHLANLPAWGTQGWHPTYGVLHFPQGRLDCFVTDIIWTIFAYFGNWTNRKEMSPSTAESLHESPAGFPDPLCSSDFWLKSQSSFGGFLRDRH